MTAKPPPQPVERTQTLRQSIRQYLEDGPHSARELSSQVGLREKDVVAHLEQLQRSLRAAGKRLLVDPAVCLSCGFVFRKRSRLSRPSACPRCREQRIDPPTFSVA